jgi:hypothetical protein
MARGERPAFIKTRCPVSGVLWQRRPCPTRRVLHTLAAALGLSLIECAVANTGLPEGSILWKPVSWQTVKLYAGVQIDNRVPVAPDLVGIDLGLGGPGAVTYETVRNFSVPSALI